MATSAEENEIAQTAPATHPVVWFRAMLLLAIAIRLPGVGRPLLGNFATKSIVYAMIARNWAEGRATLWRPTLDCLLDGQRAWHLVELPVSAYLSGWLWRSFGGSLDVWGRLVAVGWSVGSVALLHALVRRRHGPVAALAAGFCLALSPVAITCGQAFMLEPSVVFLTLVAIDGLDRWLRGGRFGWLLVSAIGLALVLLTKIYMLVLLLPLGAMLLRRDRLPGAIQGAPRSLWERDLGVRAERKHPGQRVTSSPDDPHPDPLPEDEGTERLLRSPRIGNRLLAAALLAASIVPAAVWYGDAMRTASPENALSSRVFYSVRQSAAVHCPPHPLLGSPDFYRRAFDDLATVVLTPLGLLLPLAGLMDRSWRAYGPWLAAMVLLVLALPSKFHEMNYYWLVVLPPICILAGLGCQVVYQRLRPSRRAVGLLLGLAAVVSLRYAAKPSWVTPAEDRAVPAAAAAIRRFVPEGQPVVTVHGSGIDLLYYCDRPGWAVESDCPDLPERLDSCRRQGARWLVVVGPPPWQRPPTETGEGYLIYRLDFPAGQEERQHGSRMHVTEHVVTERSEEPVVDPGADPPPLSG